VNTDKRTSIKKMAYTHGQAKKLVTIVSENCASGIIKMKSLGSWFLPLNGPSTLCNSWLVEALRQTLRANHIYSHY